MEFEFTPMILYFRVKNRVMNKKNKLFYIWSKPIFHKYNIIEAFFTLNSILEWK